MHSRENTDARGLATVTDLDDMLVLVPSATGIRSSVTTDGGITRSGVPTAPQWARRVAVALFVGVSIAGASGCVNPGTPPTVAPTPATSGTSSATATAPVTVSEPGSIEPSETVTETGTGGGATWGSHPPNHLDTARDLSDPQFPETVLTYTFEDVSVGAVSWIAGYGDDTNYLTMGATVISGFTQYEVIVEAMKDVAYQGRAVCGTPIDFPKQTKCVMVGTGEVLEVATASDVPLEQVVAFTETIYDLL